MNTMLDASLPLTVAEYEEWGNPNEPEAFAYMLSYSPYDNLKPGAYPAMLVKTSLNDSQVMYWEPAKYVAKLRTLKTNAAPLLLHTNMDAGHGGASGRYDYLKEVAFDYAFLLTQLGVVEPVKGLSRGNKEAAESLGRLFPNPSSNLIFILDSACLPSCRRPWPRRSRSCDMPSSCRSWSSCIRSRSPS